MHMALIEIETQLLAPNMLTSQITLQCMQHTDDTMRNCKELAPIIRCPGHAMAGRLQYTELQTSFKHVLPAVQAKAMAGEEGSAATLEFNQGS